MTSNDEIKMKNDEIKKALARLLDKLRAYECKNVSIDKELITNTLDLINQYEAEIKKLESHLAMSKKETKKCITHYKMACAERNEFLEQLKTSKAEAIKEFAERFKERFAKEKFRDCYTVIDEDIDNLLKEMGVE